MYFKEYIVVILQIYHRKDDRTTARG